MREHQAYRCDHCKKVYLSKTACEKHEKEWCRQNPALKAKCFYGCSHLTKEEAVVTKETYNGQVDIDVSLLWCEKKKCHIVPFWAAKKGNWYDVAYINDEELDSLFAPMECVDFKEIKK